MAYVYRHIRLDKNEPFYIGIGSSEYYNRAYRHKNRSDLWKRISVKGGYEVEILLDNLTWDQACEKEKEFIALYGRIDLKTGFLANMTDGGDGTLNAVITEKQRKAVAEANKKRIFTEEDRKRMSERHTGRKHKKESKIKLSNSLKNSEKFKLACIINAERLKNFKHSEQSKINMRNARKNPLYQKTIDGTILKIWDSARQVQRELGFNQANICYHIKGKTNQSYGYKWEYVNK
jgi:hypothetical protein